MLGEKSILEEDTWKKAKSNAADIMQTSVGCNGYTKEQILQ